MEIQENMDSRYPIESASKKQGDLASNPDRLSNLPEELRLRILSCLPIEDVVRTGVLSTRWKRLWTNLDRLVLIFYFDPKKDAGLFISFVNRVLMQCPCPNIKEFMVKFLINSSSCEVADHVLDKWIQQVVDRNVEFLTLELCDNGYTPPEWLYNSSSLVDLCLAYLNIDIPGQTVCWSSLKSLCLSSVGIDDEDMQKILLGCPILEELALICCVESISKLDIVSPNVRKLRLVPHVDNELNATVLEVNAPWLQHLKISEWCQGVFVQLCNVSSLVHANISYKNISNLFAGENCDDKLNEVAIEQLKSVRCVKELIIGHELVQASASLKLLGDPSGEPSQRFKCKRLFIYLPVVNYALDGIAYLLQNSPDLEALVVKFENLQQFRVEGVRENLNEISNFKGAMHLVHLPHLKYIKFVPCRCLCLRDKNQCNDDEHFDIELVTFILRNARILEKLVVSSGKDEDCKCSMNCASHYASSLTSKIIQFCLEGKETGKWEVIKKEKFKIEIIFSN